MRRGWGDLSSLLKDGSHGTHKEFPDSPYLLLSAKNIKYGNIIIDNNERRISKKDYDSIYKNYELKDGDILLTIVGTIGRVAIYKNQNNIAFQRSVAFFRFENNDSFFMYQLFNTISFQNELNRRKVISAQPGIYLGDLSKINLTLPPLPEQTKIATFLSAVDKKIAVLEERVERLEVYKRGVMQAMFAGSLRFKDDEGKEFPDWGERTLGEVCEMTSSKRVYLSDYVDNGVPFYRGKEITELKSGKTPSDILYISEEPLANPHKST